MEFLKIQNKGELDIRLLYLMGGTTKDENPLKIGQWGSGLKYAISWLLRHNILFKAFIGEKEIEFTTKDVEIRGTNFRVIYVNGEETSLTTNMGGDQWKPWMVVREILCNAIDEEEYSYEVTKDIVGESGYTSFYIQATPEIKKVIDNWDEYFNLEKTPIFENENCAIYHNDKKGLSIYKQGILIKRDKGVKDALFSYDVKNAYINELRELIGSPFFDILTCLSQANDRVVSYFYENISENYYEGSNEMSYEYFSRSLGESWKNVLGNAKLINEKYLDKLIENKVIQDESDYIVVPDNVYKFLNKNIKGLSALESINSSEYFVSESSDMYNRLNQAFAVLETCEYHVHPDLEWKIGVFTSPRIAAQLDLEKRLVVVSESMLAEPLFEVVCMIIEENEHYITKYSDETRAFQNHFIKLFTRQLLQTHGVEM